MQQVRPQEEVRYAGLGVRFAAVLVDTLVLFGLLILVAMVYVLVLAARGTVDLNDPAAVQALSADFQVSDWVANVVVFGGLFVYYTVLEALFGASVGKLVFRIRVTMVDGTRPGGGAVILRNLVRIPEAWLLYAPAAVSCLIGQKCQRLGDHAARTVVVRRAPVRAAGAPATPGTAPWPSQPPGGATPLPPEPPAAALDIPMTSPPPATAEPGLSEALAGLRTAALAARGAHSNYLYFSERELKASSSGAPEAAYAPEYVGAWYTLADAVVELQGAHALAETLASQTGATLESSVTDQPDLLHLLRELHPYVTAVSDEQTHEAYLQVARGDAPPA